MNKYRNLFWSNNYVLIKNFFNNYETKFIAYEANSMLYSKNQKYSKVYKNNGKTCEIEDFLRFNKGFNYFINNKIGKISREIYGNNVNLFKDKLICKFPQKKDENFEQNFPNWFSLSNKFYLTVALFPDDHDTSNGCLQFAQNKFLDKNYDYNPEKLDWETIETTNKDIIIFNCFCHRRNTPNISNHPSKIFYLTYNDADKGDFYQTLNNPYNQKIMNPIII